MPLQKSFSDQNHSGRQNVCVYGFDAGSIIAKMLTIQQERLPWKRNRSLQNTHQRDNAPAKPLAEKPPIPVSAATKNILNNFQYREQLVGEDGKKTTIIDLVSSSGSEEKENTPSPVKKIRRTPRKETQEVTQELFLAPPAPIEPPSTPSFDPTQNADFKRPIKSISPDERLIWDADKDNPRLPLPRNANLGKRKRGDGDVGRARSSSPVMDHSSPGNASALPRNLQPGPEVDIWKFAPKDHKLSHIMDMSSPHSSKDRNTPRGFTRSRSLGNPKRHQSGRVVSNGGTVDTPGLIRRLQEDFQKPQGLLSGPSSSSPLPEASHFPSDEPSSPLKAVHKRISPRKQRTLQPGSPLKDLTENNSPGRSPLKRAASVESDYGSDDGLDEIGDLILTEIESQTQAAASGSFSRPLLPRQASSSPSRCQASSKHPTSVEQSSALKANDDDEDDEFGEGLDDADFEAAFSGPTVAEEVTLPPLKSRTSEVKEDSDDEFGDGIDDADFTAAEIAATQSIKETTASSLMPVRSRYS
jgi:DNA replication ATP-dependent helicase Dna2